MVSGKSWEIAPILLIALSKMTSSCLAAPKSAKCSAPIRTAKLSRLRRLSNVAVKLRVVNNIMQNYGNRRRAEFFRVLRLGPETQVPGRKFQFPGSGPGIFFLLRVLGTRTKTRIFISIFFYLRARAHPLYRPAGPLSPQRELI